MENNSKDNGFEKILEEAGFVVVDGEVDYSVAYTKENLMRLLEKMTEKAQSCATGIQEVTAQLGELANKNEEEYSRATEIIAKASGIVEKSQRELEVIRKELDD